MPESRMPFVLIPFDLREAMDVGEAAQISGRNKVTVREWVANYDLGRRIGGRWQVSRVAFAMHLDGNKAALRAYLSGDRESPAVVAYFARFSMEPTKITLESDKNEGNEGNALLAASDSAQSFAER